MQCLENGFKRGPRRIAGELINIAPPTPSAGSENGSFTASSPHFGSQFAMILSQGKWRCTLVCHLAGKPLFSISICSKDPGQHKKKKHLLEKQHQIISFSSKLFTFNGFISMTAATHFCGWLSVSWVLGLVSKVSKLFLPFINFFFT